MGQLLEDLGKGVLWPEKKIATKTNGLPGRDLVDGQLYQTLSPEKSHPSPRPCAQSAKSQGTLLHEIYSIRSPMHSTP